jgi:hypothetical protein
MATATLCAVPVVVLTTVRDWPAVRTSVTKFETAANGVPAAPLSPPGRM